MSCNESEYTRPRQASNFQEQAPMCGCGFTGGPPKIMPLFVALGVIA
jgi:hypothetical protein